MVLKHRSDFLSGDASLAQFVDRESQCAADEVLDQSALTLLVHARTLVAAALSERGPAYEDVQLALHKMLSWRIADASAPGERSALLFAIRRDIERIWSNIEFARCASDALPVAPGGFESWMRGLVERHPAARHPLYDFIAERADLTAFRTFIAAESTVDARFDDLLALTQLGVSGDAKVEIARNYWDEMGAGDSATVHTTMFSKVCRAIDLNAANLPAPSAEALACGNLLLMYASDRGSYDLAIGALGVTEALAPFRFRRVIEGWNRLALDDDALEYYRLHVHVDDDHTTGWINEVIAPRLETSPETLAPICQGVLTRLNTSLDYCVSLSRRVRTDV